MPDTKSTAKIMLPADFADAPISVVRRSLNALVTFAAIGAVALVLLPLAAVFGYLIYKGIGSINLAFLTQIPKPPGEAGGGMANAIAGSVYILMIASVFGVLILMSAILTASLFWAAYPIAEWYHDPRLVPLIQVSSLGFLFNALTTLPRAYLTKSLRIRPMFIMEMVQPLSSPNSRPFLHCPSTNSTTIPPTSPPPPLISTCRIKLEMPLISLPYCPPFAPVSILFNPKYCFMSAALILTRATSWGDCRSRWTD
jgi:hypothetical protein